MRMPLRVAQYINLVLVVLVSGVLCGAWLGLSRSIGSFSANTYLDIGHAMIANLAPVMPALILSSVASAIVVAVCLHHQRSTGLPLNVAGILLLLVVIGITL